MLRAVVVRCLALLGAAALLGCGDADHYDALPSPSVAGEVASGVGEHPEAELLERGEGSLEIATRSSVSSFLGATHCVVEDAAGQVVAGIHEETTTTASEASPLVLSLPAGDGYTVRLTATTQDTAPTTCRATVGPIRVEAGAAAHVRVFAWDCGDRMGYVPQAAQDDCFWLADWSFVGRTHVALGDSVEVGVVASGSEAERFAYRWSTATPELGSFGDAGAATTPFRCSVAGEQPLEVLIDDGLCQQRVTQAISCR